jgi:hypothetical protein
MLCSLRGQGSMSAILILILLALLYIGWVLSAPARKEKREHRAHLNDLIKRANLARERYFASITATEREWLRKHRKHGDKTKDIRIGDPSLEKEWLGLVDVAVGEGINPITLVPRTRGDKELLNKLREQWWPEDKLRVGHSIAEARRSRLIVISLVALVGLAGLYSWWKSESEQAELARVVIQAKYGAEECKGDKPLHVFIGNASSKTVKAVRWELKAYVPGHSTDVMDYLSKDYTSDAILEPNKGISYCYPVPKLNTNVDPALLEYKTAHPDITFAEGQGD